MVGLYFPLRSGSEHQELRLESSQKDIVEREGDRTYLLYTITQKNHPSGLKGRHIKPKTVQHHANTDNPPEDIQEIQIHLPCNSKGLLP